MAVTETQPHDLHTHFQETMGRERAAVMMDLLPPVGWGDVATKQDLTHLATREDLFALKSELTEFHERVLDKMATQLLAMMGINATFWSVGVGFVATLVR